MSVFDWRKTVLCSYAKSDHWTHTRFWLYFQLTSCLELGQHRFLVIWIFTSAAELPRVSRTRSCGGVFINDSACRVFSKRSCPTPTTTSVERVQDTEGQWVVYSVFDTWSVVYADVRILYLLCDTPVSVSILYTGSTQSGHRQQVTW